MQGNLFAILPRGLSMLLLSLLWYLFVILHWNVTVGTMTGSLRCHGIKEDLGIRNLIQPFGCQDSQMNCRPTHIWRRSVSAESSERVPNMHFLL